MYSQTQPPIPGKNPASYYQTDDDTEVLPFTPVFLGGAPRTGTTVMHALLCTAEKSNPYIGECTYFSAFMTPYLAGLKNFDTHTRHYFSSREEFTQNHADVLRRELTKIWRRLGNPEFLVLKDPLLTPFFPHLATLLKQAQFVVSVRDPRGAIASRIEVAGRRWKNFPISYKKIAAYCDEYSGIYRAIHENRSLFGNRLHLLDYTDVVNKKSFDKLEELGIGKVYPDKIWTRTAINIKDYSSDVWSTPLYGRPLSASSTDRYTQTLSPVMEAFILERCEDAARSMGCSLQMQRSLPGKLRQYLDIALKRFSQLFLLVCHPEIRRSLTSEYGWKAEHLLKI